MSQKIRVFIVDDHDMFRDGVKLLLASDSVAEVVGEARDGKEFLEKVEGAKPDLVLMDISMPVMDGVEASRIAHEKYPDLKILALTMFGDEKYYHQMIQNGIKGFVLKSSGISELIKALSEVHTGGNFFSSEILYKLIKSISTRGEGDSLDAKQQKLTGRELEILKLIATGYSNEDIAKDLNISASTVKTHRNSLLSKTSTNNTASLIMYALKNNLIEVS